MERFLDYFTPELYQLELCLFRTKNQIRGSVIIEGEITESDFIKLHAVNMQIKNVGYQTMHWPASCKHKTNQSEHETEFIECEFEYNGAEIKIPIDATMRKRANEMAAINKTEDLDDRKMLAFRIEFETEFNQNLQGCYLSTYEFAGKTQKIITTQFESHYAREAFPCIDEPAAKAFFDLTLLVPDFQHSYDVALANTPLKYQEENRFEFDRTPKMSTYLLAWVIGPLKNISTVNKNGVKVASYCALNQPVESLLFANEVAARALEYYDEKFGVQYPLEKLDQVALPDFEAGAMENWGLVTYRESMMLADQNASLDVKRSVATVVTHELSHQWFGNLVTMKWWDDLWLNESFATVIEYFCADALYPELKVWQDFFTGNCLAALRRDCLPGVQAVKQPVHSPAEIATLFDGAIVYAKGARLILMLMRLLGEEKFHQGLRDYFEKFSYNNTVGDDLWQALQPYADFDIKTFMDAWISQPGYPALQKSQNSNHELWSQQRFLIDGSTDETQWPLPDVKDDMSGHYLINLSDAEFQQRLADFDQLKLEQKLRVLIDRMLLAKATIVPADSLLDLLPKFQSEASAAVLEIVAGIIADLKLFCPPESDVAGNYKKFLHNIYRERFSAIDFAPLQDADAVCARDILLSLARYAEDEKILQQLIDLYQDDFSQIDPELRAHVLAAKLKRDDAEVFTNWLEKYQSLADPEIKRTLLAVLASAVEQPAHLDRLIALLEETSIVRPQDHIFLYIYLLRNHRTRERVIKWLTEHWDFVSQLAGDKSIEDYPRYAANVICTANEAQIFHDFFDTKLSDPSLARALEIARVEIAARLDLITHNSPRIAERLKVLAES